VAGTELRKALLEPALAVAPRILGLMDRSPNSPTYGCAERYFWRYRLHDFPNARFQEVGLYLARLYCLDLPENTYRAKVKIRDWALAAAIFWPHCQNRDGSCQELYPLERSACATAFSTFAAAETLRLLNPPQDLAGLEAVRNSLSLAGRWLSSHAHATRDVANQAAAAACALVAVGNLLGEATLLDAAETAVRQLARDFDAHGFMPEYGGFDLGYQTVTCGSLAWYAKMGPVEGRKIAHWLVREALAGMDDRIDRHGNYDISHMSRGTSYIYPSGFTISGGGVPSKLARGLAAGAILSPTWLDDRYCIALASDYLAAVAADSKEAR
jgi:hypothetical protein